jgi:putative nucleotidyltransferase with HDIG domain
MAAIMVFPWQWAVVVVTVSAVIGRRGVWYKRAFNASHTTLSCGAAALVWAHRASVLAIADPALVPWILATVVAYLVCSSLLVSTMVAFASDLPVRVTFWRAHRHQWPSTFGMTFVGVLIAVLWSSSAWSVVLAAIPLTAIYYSLRNTSSLETTTMSALFNLADILDARDPYTHGHSLRVGEYAEKLALALGVSADEAHLIFLAGRLHDIGKCAIKNEVLLKPAALNEEEREHMCIHPEVGSSMLASFSMFSECARYVRGHHERWDGAGYPDRLAGEQIPYGARIIAVVDAYDAMTTTRPYRKALPLTEAYKRLSEGAGIQWDPRAVAAFLKLLDSTPVAPAEPVPLLARSDRLAA